MTIGIADRSRLDCLSVEVTNNVLVDLLERKKNRLLGGVQYPELISFLKEADLSNVYLLSEKLIRASSVKFNVVKNAETFESDNGTINVDLMDMSSMASLLKYIHASYCNIIYDSDYGTHVSAPDEVIDVLKTLNISSLDSYSMTFLAKWRVIVSIKNTRLNAFVKEVIRFKKSEEIKRHLVFNGAPVKLVQLLFPEEHHKVYRARQRILNTQKKSGRPRIGSESEYNKFSDVWYKWEKGEMPLLSRFMAAHEALGLDYGILYGFFNRYEETRLPAGMLENSACRIYVS
ncbi:DUF2857 domain-containing protein [Vibrio fluvialis]|nr:DUF2857 domain-containing protein [Vibrio fluvialis]